MKKLFLLSGCILLAVGALSLTPLTVALAADTNSPADSSAQVAPTAAAQPTTAAPTVATPAAARLPYGLEDIVKLSRAQISEDIILNYVRSSGTVYNLRPQDIVTLKNEGVSDHVISAMLDQRRAAAEMASQAITQPAPMSPAPAPDSSAPVVTPLNAPPDSASAYADTAPSTAYVIPYSPAPYYGYYSPYSYPYSYPYYGYGPVVTFGFGYGGWGHGGWGHGGWGRGGWGHGGGGHFGGGHGGGHR